MNVKVIIISVAIFFVLVIVSNSLLIVFGGKNVPTPEIPREVTKIGEGETLRFLIIGDSTAVTQGAAYSDGYVVAIANELSEDYEVAYKNNAVSGATVVDVANNQLNDLDKFVPDIVLVAAGANDVTHLTRLSVIENSLREIIGTVRTQNPKARIVFTGAAAMDTVKRFPLPARWLVGIRTHQINNVFRRTLSQENVYFVDIAEKTRETFADRPGLLAEDNFHPNAAGYAEWTKVLLPAVQAALNQ